MQTHIKQFEFTNPQPVHKGVLYLNDRYKSTESTGLSLTTVSWSLIATRSLFKQNADCQNSVWAFFFFVSTTGMWKKKAEHIYSGLGTLPRLTELFQVFWLTVSSTSYLPPRLGCWKKPQLQNYSCTTIRIAERVNHSISHVLPLYPGFTLPPPLQSSYIRHFAPSY